MKRYPFYERFKDLVTYLFHTKRSHIHLNLHIVDLLLFSLSASFNTSLSLALLGKRTWVKMSMTRPVQRRKSPQTSVATLLHEKNVNTYMNVLSGVCLNSYVSILPIL